MRFSCKSCKANYSIADEKIRGKVIKVRCKKCNRLLVVRDNSVDEFAQSSDTQDNVLPNDTLEQEFDRAFDGILEARRKADEPYSTSAVDLEPVWYCGLDGTEEGPLTLLDMEERIRDGLITPEHFVWRDGLDDWLPIEECNELVHFFRLRSTPKPTNRKAKIREQEKRRKTEEEEKLQAEEKKLRAEKEKLRAKEERLKAEKEKLRLAEEEKLRLAEEEKLRLAEEEKLRLAEEEKLRLAEKEKLRLAEKEKLRLAEKEKLRKTEEKKKRKKQEKENRKKRKEEILRREAQEQILLKEEEKQRRKADEELLIQEHKHKEKLAKQPRQRQKIRTTPHQPPHSNEHAGIKPHSTEDPAGDEFKQVKTDIHTREISEDFFTSGERGKEQEELLPPPPVIDLEAADAARLLAEQIEDEQGSQKELESIGSRREEWGEVSRVIAKQAGVASQGRRSAVGFLVVLLVLACLVSLVALALSQGWFGSELEHFQIRKKENNSFMVNPQASEKLSSKDHQRISGIWTVEQKRKQQTKQRARPSAVDPLSMNLPRIDDQRPKVLSKDEKELLAFYEQQNEQKRELKPRGPISMPNSMAKIDMPSSGSNFNMEANLEKKIEATPNDRGYRTNSRQLTQEQVKLVINRHKRQIQKCLERQLKRDPVSKGKALVTAIVLPDGTVKQVDIEPAKFHGTYLEECMKREIKLWRFPSFQGEPYNLQFPFILKARESY